MSSLPDLPTVRFGLVAGPLRLESVTGPDCYFASDCGQCHVINVRPREIDGKMYAVTHLQKKSRWGFLCFSPFIFHVWFTWRFQKQETKPDGAVVWIPGSELVTYLRTPGQRFDFAQAKFIRSRGYFSFTHWD